MKTIELKILLEDLTTMLLETSHQDEKLENKRKNLLVISKSLREDLI